MCDYRKRMSYKRGVDGLHVCSVQIRVLDVVQQCVTPVQSVRSEIHGQTVWPSQCDVTEHDQIRTVGVRTANVGRPVPFGKEYIPEIH